MGMSVDFSLSSQWDAGFIAEMTIGNLSGASVDGWTIEFDAPFQITNLWNGQIVSHVGNHYVVRNASWNATIPGNGQVTFGFQATNSGPVTEPDHVLVNGDPLGGDDGASPQLAVGDATVTEGNGGTHYATFSVSLSEASGSPVSVDFSTASGSAAAGSDFLARSGTLVFAPGETAKTVQVAVQGDTQVEGDESFRLVLSNPAGATIADGEGLGTIVDDDVAPPTLPTLSIGDRANLEGDSGTKKANFTVTLSAASDSPVSVNFATRGVTAEAGQDFVDGRGTITFAPGEVSKTITVLIQGDTQVEGDETYQVRLSSPTGATIDDGTAWGTIRDNDVGAGPPSLSVSDLSVKEGDPGAVRPAEGFFSTEGNQIIDADGNSVKIAGVNWFGMESGRFSPDGLHTRNYQDMMDQMKELGFNTIRLPFSNAMFDPGATAGSINYNLNPELKGLTPLQIMDAVVDYAGEIGMRIILDHHRSSAGAGPNSNGLWYEGAYDEARWIDDWVMLADRYAGNPAVIGADLHNEPHNGTWGGGGATDWAAAAERAGNAIQAVNDDWLIVVEGVGAYNNQYYWWGGNLMGVADRPVDLNVDNKVVYSPHDYPNSIYAQPWFSDPSFPDNLTDKFDQNWGYIYKQGIAPILLGEFGSRLTDPKDVAWFDKITAYLSGDLDANGSHDLPAGDQGMSWTWWSWNPNSGDTGGILADDWKTVLQDKVDGLDPLMFTFEDVSGGGSGAPAELTTLAEFDIALSAASDQVVSVDYATADGSAGADDYHGVSGSVTFQPGETSKTVQVEIVRDAVNEGDETFVFNLSNPHNATLAHPTATATIVDDDLSTAPREPSPADGPADGSAAGPGSLSAAVTIDDDWGSGFVAQVSLDNSGSTTVEDWSVRLEMPYEIVDIWNAEIVSHEGDVYEIRHTEWNDSVGAGQSVGFGFQATPGNVAVDQFDWMI